jgi:hypothetical protein
VLVPTTESTGDLGLCSSFPTALPLPRILKKARGLQPNCLVDRIARILGLGSRREELIVRFPVFGRDFKPLKTLTVEYCFRFALLFLFSPHFSRQENDHCGELDRGTSLPPCNSQEDSLSFSTDLEELARKALFTVFLSKGAT